MHIVIIGLGTAGFAAALTIRKHDRNAKLTIIDSKDFDLLHSCGLPYALEGKIDLKSLQHSINAQQMKITLLSGYEATKIISERKQVEYINIKTNSKSALAYDRLLISTGSMPFLPPIEYIKDKKNLFVLKNTSDVDNLENALKKAKTAAVLGAGAIGLETAYALRSKGLNVTLIEALGCLLPRALDTDISLLLQNHLKEKGLDILLNSEVTKIEGTDIFLKNKQVKADIIISAVGVKPNLHLAESSGIKVAKFGISVNDYLQTSEKEIYAAGDCIESFNLITKSKFPSQLATTAYRQGIIAAENILGKKTKYKGTVSAFASVIGDLEIASTGLNSFYAEQAKLSIVSGKSISNDRPEWFCQPEKITLKILADSKSQKILGAQAIGKNSSHWINVVATAINAGMNLADLRNVEFAYCPTVSETYDVLHQAVDLALRKLG